MKCPVCRATYRSSESRRQRTEAREPEAKSFTALLEQQLEVPRDVTLLPHPSRIPPASLDPQLPSSLPSLPCHRCGVDLAPLIHIHDQAVWYHRQAIQAFNVGDYGTAMIQNNQAIALYSSRADFHAFAGQLWALQGEFQRAIAAWKKAQQLEPNHPISTALLQSLQVQF